MTMIYDLSGSPVAAASMITPFVPSPAGSDCVLRSNPGAWLILCPHGVSVSSWNPWGHLEAWRERGPIDFFGYKFELVTENGPDNGIPIAEAAMSIKKGGQFCIDRRVSRDSALSLRWSPVIRICYGIDRQMRSKGSQAVVQVGIQHVTCMADAARTLADFSHVNFGRSLALTNMIPLLKTLLKYPNFPANFPCCSIDNQLVCSFSSVKALLVEQRAGNFAPLFSFSNP